jgi:hypothetical protein
VEDEASGMKKSLTQVIELCKTRNLEKPAITCQEIELVAIKTARAFAKLCGLSMSSYSDFVSILWVVLE